MTVSRVKEHQDGDNHEQNDGTDRACLRVCRVGFGYHLKLESCDIPLPMAPTFMELNLRVEATVLFGLRVVSPGKLALLSVVAMLVYVGSASGSPESKAASK